MSEFACIRLPGYLVMFTAEACADTPQEGLGGARDWGGRNHDEPGTSDDPSHPATANHPG